MAIDLGKFTGTLPYASELVGVYQPLLGWKSQRIRIRFRRQHWRLLNTAIRDIAAKGPDRGQIHADPRPTNPDQLLPIRLPGELGGLVGQRARHAATNFIARNGRYPANSAEWQAVLASADFAGAIRQVAAVESGGRARAASTRVPLASAQVPFGAEDTVHLIAAQRPPDASAVGVAAAAPGPKVSAMHEAATAGALEHLAAHAPDTLRDVLALRPAFSHLFGAARDPLADLDHAGGKAVLSPIGLVNVYRQYFYEFDTFLGPPVGHVWVSPGGMVELYEVNTRRTRQEREVESTLETTFKSETESSDEDELSTKVAEENSRNISMGVTASGGVNFGVAEASASASLGLEFNHKVSQETAHRHTRKQSEKLANEIRRSFKTVIRTSVETEDVSSRRHVLQNTTDKLINYELRRKMRQVGVQVQHIDTQLCWQVFVDEPGAALGMSSLVHAAAQPDLSGLQPPEAPTKQPPKKEQYVFDFPFEAVDEEATDDGMDEDYHNGQDIEEDPGEGRIRWHKTIDVAPPAADYKLASVAIVSFAGTTPDEDPPNVTADCQPASESSFECTLSKVNFNDNAAIRFTVDLVWDPPEISAETQQAYEEKRQQYEEGKSQAYRDSYVKTVRERIKLASIVPDRPEKDLREEERTVICRRLVAQLCGASLESAHLTSELIRAIFDVDKMLYFVAPEWWLPRQQHKQHLGPKVALTGENTTNWGVPPGRPNYHITEEANPAPLGASLGWLIQLDGDSHRNAFLNSPWVKAVIPIRPGREKAAVDWLKLAHVEGSADLNAAYAGPEPELQGKTIEEVLNILAERIQALGTDITNTLATEHVFEHGFDPLEGGFRATGPFEIFDQWIEVLPTDQVVAVEYAVASTPVEEVTSSN